jgi:ABC-2 type transport system ATP-binding protein
MTQLDLMNKIGFMSQSDALYAGLTGKDIMEFFGSLYSLKNHALKDRISETLRLVNMTDYQDIPVRAYSGGMKRRLSLAMSLLHEPPLLLLDEPTVGIDPVLRHDIWQELYKIARVGTTIVVTTHVMDEAGKCDTLAMMRDGVLLAVGSPAEIIRQSGQNSIEEAFIYFSTGEAGDIHAG